MEKIDVEEIMEKIREDIKEKGYKDSDLSFSDVPLSIPLNNDIEIFNLDVLLEKLKEANESVGVHYYNVIESRGIKGIIKKAIRKTLKFLLYPLCQGQERNNAFSIQAMNQMLLYIQELEKRIDNLEKVMNKKGR